jgi:hypothetical protein
MVGSGRDNEHFALVQCSGLSIDDRFGLALDDVEDLVDRMNFFPDLLVGLNSHDDKLRV